METEDKISERFKTVRKQSGMNQKDFAEKLNVTQSVVSDIERGSREPSRSTIITLAEVFNIDLNWLLLGKGSDPEISQKQINEDPKVQELETEIRELKKSIDQLEKENNELSHELLDRMRELLRVRDNLQGSEA